MKNFYQEDLAYIHHSGFGTFAHQTGNEILKMFQKKSLEKGLVVDLGCGSGIWAAKLISAGYKVLGVDVSADMLALARQNASKAEFLKSSVFDVEIPPCQCVTALGEVLCYTSQDTSPPDLGSFFQRVADKMQSGGLLIFDVIGKSESESMDYRIWNKSSDWAVLIDSQEDKQANLVNREITIFRKVGDSFRRSEECHQVIVFDENQLKRQLEDAGFSIEVSDHYGQYNLAPRRLGFVATKR